MRGFATHVLSGARQQVDQSNKPVTIDNFEIFSYAPQDGRLPKQVFFVLADITGKLAAFAGFNMVDLPGLPDTALQASHVETYAPYQSRRLIGKLYKYLHEQQGVIICSDIKQTESGRKLWEVTLPALGLHPQIYDTGSDTVIDPSAGIDMYPHIDIEPISPFDSDELAAEKEEKMQQLDDLQSVHFWVLV